MVRVRQGRCWSRTEIGIELGTGLVGVDHLCSWSDVDANLNSSLEWPRSRPYLRLTPTSVLGQPNLIRHDPIPSLTPTTTPRDPNLDAFFGLASTLFRPQPQRQPRPQPQRQPWPQPHHRLTNPIWPQPCCRSNPISFLSDHDPVFPPNPTLNFVTGWLTTFPIINK